MALIICTECGKEFSSMASACPNCGCPNAVNEVTQSQTKIDNYLRLSQIALDGGNGAEAFDYVAKALELDAANPDAWTLKMKAARLRHSTFGDADANEIIAAGRQVLKLSGDHIEEAEQTVYSFFAETAVENELAVWALCKQTPSCGSATGVAGAVLATTAIVQGDTKIINTLYVGVETAAMMLADAIPDEILQKYPSIAQLILGLAEARMQMTDMMQQQYKLAWIGIKKEWKEARQRTTEVLRQRAFSIAKIDSTSATPTVVADNTSTVPASQPVPAVVDHSWKRELRSKKPGITLTIIGGVLLYVLFMLVFIFVGCNLSEGISVLFVFMCPAVAMLIVGINLLKSASRHNRQVTEKHKQST